MKQLLRYFLVILIPFSFACHKAAGQAGYSGMDSLTYSLYLKQDWKALVEAGKTSLHSGVDYYYLRMRMGIAYYQLGKYVTASRHFEKALKFNKNDQTSLGYLFSSYILSNNVNDARALTPVMEKQVLDAAGYQKKTVESVYMEGGMNFSNGISGSRNLNLMGNDSIYGEKDSYGNNTYIHLGFKLNITPKLSVYAGYSNLSFTKQKKIDALQYERYDSTQFSWGYYYKYRDEVKHISHDYKLHQHQLYIKANLVAGGMAFTPFFHYLMVNYTSIETVKDTVHYWSQIYDSVQSVKTVYSFPMKDTSFNNFVAGITFSKKIGVFDLSLSGSYSNLNGKEQYEAGLSAYYFPWGNLDYYGNTLITGFFEGSTRRLLLNQLIGMKVMSRLWGEVFFNYGNVANTNQLNGFVVYNTIDQIRYASGANLIIPFNRHFDFSVSYSFSQKQGSYLQYGGKGFTGKIKEQSVKTSYQNHSIIGGIKWKI